MARKFLLAWLGSLVGITMTFAQSSTPPGIDVEIYNSGDGSNLFCVETLETFWVNVLVRPGPGATSCTLSCGSTMPGGTAHIATGVVDVSFDPARVQFQAVETNSATVASQGLIQDNVIEGRIGWALAGNWTTPGNPASTLLDPCAMIMLDSSAWVYRIQFTAGSSPGMAHIHLRRPSDGAPFALSFADICSSPAFTAASGDVDEVIDANVLIAADCTGWLFADSFDSGDLNQWSNAYP